jgi:putative oxidoreductase
VAGSEGAPHVWDFFKNFAIVGGCIFIILGSDVAAEVEKVVESPSAPSHQSAEAR